jgi:hypothetical protein
MARELNCKSNISVTLHLENDTFLVCTGDLTSRIAQLDQGFVMIPPL